MQVEDRELTLAARAMIELFGAQAPAKAQERAQDYIREKDPEGEEFWTLLTEKIESLLNAKS
jgi:hypothetical protein